MFTEAPKVYVQRYPFSSLFLENFMELRDGSPVVTTRGEVSTVAELERAVDGKGDVKILCPWHSDTVPSLSVSLAKGIFNCFGCGRRGSIYELVAEVLDTTVASDDVTRVVHEGIHEYLAPRIETWNRTLMNNEGLLQKFERERAISQGIALRYKIGWTPTKIAGSTFGTNFEVGTNEVVVNERVKLTMGDVREPLDGWLTIPLRGLDGNYLNVKMHHWPREKTTPNVHPVGKANWYLSGFIQGQTCAKVYDRGLLFFPIDQLSIAAGTRELWLTEGELDALAWISQGVREKADMAVVSTTGGATSWSLDHGTLLDRICRAGSDERFVVNIFYDDDEAGRKGAKKVASDLIERGFEVYMVDWGQLRAALKLCMG